MGEPNWNFEGERPFDDMSETGINLCAYFDAMPDEKMQSYRPDMSDEELMRWDGNFTTDGDLLLPCCETEDVDPAMYRRYIETCIRYRRQLRAKYALVG